MGKLASLFIGYYIVVFHISTVVVVPTKFVKNQSKITTQGKSKDDLRTLIKSPDKLEKAEKKSDVKKKTSISINGNVVPIAGMAETDKTVHVTIQNKAGQPGTQPGVAQPLIQEVVPGTQQNTAPQIGASPPVGMSPPTNIGLAQPVNVGMSPPTNIGMSPPTNIGMSPPTNIGMSPPTNIGMSPPTNIGMSPPTNVGMSPPMNNIGMSPPQMVGQPAVGLAPGTNIPVNIVSNNQLPSSLVPVQTINNPQVTNGQAPCQNTNNNLQSGNLVHLDKNSEGQLIYKPVAC